MSRDGPASDANVKRSASVPNAAIPSGNCLRVAFSMPGARCGCIRPVVRFFSNASSVMPSTMSSGSMTLPLAFAIAHQAVHVHLAERHVAHELHAEHDHAGNPEEDDVEARDQHIARIEAL